MSRMMKELCEAQRKLAEAGIMLGYVVRPDSITKSTSARLIYLLRMKPFSSIGYPAPPEMNFGDEESDLNDVKSSTNEATELDKNQKRIA